MNAGKIAAITGGVVSFAVIGGLLFLNRKHLFHRRKATPVLTEDDKADGYYYLPNGEIASKLPDGRSLVLSGTKDPDEYDSDSEYYNQGGKRRRTRRKSKGRK